MPRQSLMELDDSTDQVLLGVPRWSLEEMRVDVRVGSQVGQRREQLALTAAELADAIGISTGQLVMHECGELRLGAPRLLRLARALDVPVSYFFEGL